MLHKCFTQVVLSITCLIMLGTAESYAKTSPAPKAVAPTEQNLLAQAKSGDSEAAYSYGKQLYRGLAGEAPNLKEAAYWLSRSAQQSNPDAALLLATLYKSGKLQAQKPNSARKLFQFAFTLLKSAAENGDASAMAKIGIIYSKGVFVKRDPKIALEWLEKAVAGGNPKAKSVLGRYTIWGNTKGYTEADALRLLHEAAQGGIISAWIQLGLAYSGAYNGTVNLPRAFDCFKKAAALGSIEGRRQMGIAYLAGLGVKKDVSEGYRLISEAANNGNIEAMYNKAVAYRLGVGTAENTAEYINWLKKAAANDHSDAAYLLGDAYRYGKGVAANRSEAIRYLTLSKNKANVLAIHALEDMKAENAEKLPSKASEAVSQPEPTRIEPPKAVE